MTPTSCLTHLPHHQRCPWAQGAGSHAGPASKWGPPCRTWLHKHAKPQTTTRKRAVQLCCPGVNLGLPSRRQPALHGPAAGLKNALLLVPMPTPVRPAAACVSAVAIRTSTQLIAAVLMLLLQAVVCWTHVCLRLTCILLACCLHDLLDQHGVCLPRPHQRGGLTKLVHSLHIRTPQAETHCYRCTTWP